MPMHEKFEEVKTLHIKDVSPSRLSDERRHYQNLKLNNLVSDQPLADADPLSSFRDGKFFIGESENRTPPQVRTNK